MESKTSIRIEKNIRNGLVGGDSITMNVEGSDGATAIVLAEDFLRYLKEEEIKSEAEEASEEISTEEGWREVAAVDPMIDHDVVAIYDNAGIPSFMHRFRRITDKELFGGSDKVHPAFKIGEDTYDEIYISVFENTMINGKPYSLPHAEPVTEISMEEFADACFSKGEGWHCMTAAEWGLMANTSFKNGTLPHGNTDNGNYHADQNEHGEKYDNFRTLAGSGPKTWTHDHTETGVHDLCGNIYEFCRGMRIKDGALYAAKDNDAALPSTDLSVDGDGWERILDDEGKPVYVSVQDGEITFTTDNSKAGGGWTGTKWKDVKFECESEALREFAVFAGEPEAYCYIDSSKGEYIQYRGGSWNSGSNAGVICFYLDYTRSITGTNIGGRSAYFRKLSTEN